MSESAALARARAYCAAALHTQARELYPVFHATGGVGWINDPNGFSVYRGEYHLFFQYHPYDTIWGPMHWGHVKSRDFLHWERLPVALAPDMPYDADGCFSGSAVELPDGRQMLMYTGVRGSGEGDTEVFQTQCLALGDGRDYVKYARNPVLDGSAVPEGGSVRDFRDPRIWREDGRYYAVAGNRSADGSGAILLYESDDAFTWRFVTVLDASGGEYGKMWECPDFFPLDGKQWLLTSPQEMRADAGGEYHDGYGTLAIRGSYAPEGHIWKRERMQTVDYGPDFYAPQTLLTPDGRRVMIAWMQDWDTAPFRTGALPFHGQMTLPRELRMQNGRLYQTPVRELEACRGRTVTADGVALDGETELPGVRGRVLDLRVRLRPEAGGAPYRAFRLSVARGEGYETEILCLPEEGTVRVRRRAGFPEELCNERAFPADIGGGDFSLRVLLDRWSMEVFVNEGERASSWVLYAPQTAEGIRFASEGALRMDVRCSELVL